jgi:glucosamine-6-phosphate deaminase
MDQRHMDRKKEIHLTPVENRALENSSFGSLYGPLEKIPTLTVDNFPALGRLAAMRFIEWVQANPEGVVSLPTGKTPEHFIRWINHALANWDEATVRAELEKYGVDPGNKPQMHGLHFVQIDEFYPIDSGQQNSFFSYVSRFYLEGFGLDPDRAMLIDCNRIGLSRDQTLAGLWPDGEVDLSLRHRAAVGAQEQRQQAALTRIDQWCMEYEDKIRSLGGIGFFLGGIGPDGHIGFNVRGSDHLSTTRLCPVNYETQAAAAGDLGGIEVAKKRLVITIGLGTIAYNPDVCALIIAAGEAKAGIVAQAIQEKANVNYPATALHGLTNARFYITMGAAKALEQRQLALIKQAPALDDAQVEKILVDLAADLGKSLDQLQHEDLESDPQGAAVLQKRPETAEILADQVRRSLIDKIERGSGALSSTRFLHTEPHHDDLMLGYLPYIIRNIRDASNTHHFVCLTGGFTAVTNDFIVAHARRLEDCLYSADFATLIAEDYFDPGDTESRNRDVWQYLDGVAANDNTMRDEGAARRFLRNLIETFGDEVDPDKIKDRLQWLHTYFADRYPGQKDEPQIQQLKGMCREWEAECLWGYLGWDCYNVKHLRLGFYTGDIFTKEPTVQDDVLPVQELVETVKPDIISVALDPEASGPDTHYKVLQAVTEALKRYEEQSGRSDLKIWGYRNVWYRFHPCEANIFVPVTLNMFALMHNAFMNTFISQKDASFPSYEHDGPFSELAQRVQVEQYQKIKICLGREWFQRHPSPLIRATRGLVFLTEMGLEDFYAHSRALRQVAEDQ